MSNIIKDIPGTSKLRIGMIGGGEGAYFASLHRAAMRLSNRYELVAGVFSSNPDKSFEAGLALRVTPDRVYQNIEQMAAIEVTREDCIDAVVIVTPNHLHYEACKVFISAGIPVICDKPLVNEVEHAHELVRLAGNADVFVGVTYTYQGYPLVREARKRIQNGDIGEVRFVYVEYLLEWLAPGVDTLNSSLAWRGDPAKAGITSVVGDIGTHAFNMMEFLVGRRCRELSARLSNKVSGWKMDDHCVAQFIFDNDLEGLMWVSFAAPGHRNGLRFKVVGSTATFEWSQENPEILHLKPMDGAELLLRRGQSDCAGALAFSSLPAGCSEGYLEALAVLYNDFAEAVIGSSAQGLMRVPVPDLVQGVRGVELSHRCYESSTGKRWVEF
ncbi:Gfo/Idh/MocA family protein [Pseudomonas fulva]|uniref:Gfo/Idh/MocA family protein n=1 Tax=Pseudomonas fulva TaxID=47880 RepID=UPI0018AA07CB|nr:Gfo/Idh/MocA family oxidoreductase [Pseudomonas fulva]MBF8774068.1 Gfo/Idh/MocA family oxidoreductase [Pseudomonas fulva]